MFTEEAARPEDMDFISIVTPNYMHYPVAISSLDAGLSVG